MPVNPATVEISHTTSKLVVPKNVGMVGKELGTPWFETLVQQCKVCLCVVVLKKMITFYALLCVAHSSRYDL